MARLSFLILALLFLCGAGETPQAVSASCSGGWTNCTNALVDDTAYARTTTSGSGTYMDFTDWNFSVPQQARIRGLQILARAYHTPDCNPIGAGSHLWGLVTPDGSTWSVAVDFGKTTTSAVELTAGNGGYLWLIPLTTVPLDWSPNHFNEDTLTVRLYATWGVAGCLVGPMGVRVEYARIKVFYSMPDNSRLYHVERSVGKKASGVEIE